MQKWLLGALASVVMAPVYAGCENVDHVVGLSFKPGIEVRASDQRDIDGLVQLMQEHHIPNPKLHAGHAQEALWELTHNPMASFAELQKASGEDPKTVKVFSATVWCAGILSDGRPGAALRDDKVAVSWQEPKVKTHKASPKKKVIRPHKSCSRG